MSSKWSYMPLWDAVSYFEYPEYFGFGIGDDDDAVFDQAWAFMLSHNMPVVVFPGDVDSDDLERASAILLRAPLPEEVSQSIPPAVALSRIVLANREAIFPDNRHADVAAMMFGGTVLTKPS